MNTFSVSKLTSVGPFLVANSDSVVDILAHYINTGTVCNA